VQQSALHPVDVSATVVDRFLDAVRSPRIPDCDVWASVTADVVLCAGRWPAALMAEMEAAGA
jgi:hypothetical protein